MSAVVDVGDAFELTFASVANATVTVTWLNPGGAEVIGGDAVEESTPGSGLYPVTLVTSSAGMWQAIFTASGAVTAVETYYVRSREVTGPAPLAAIGDVTGQFGQLTTAQEGVTSFLLRSASAMVRHNFPYVDLQLLSGRLDPEVAGRLADRVILTSDNPRGEDPLAIIEAIFAYDPLPVLRAHAPEVRLGWSEPLVTQPGAADVAFQIEPIAARVAASAAATLLLEQTPVIEGALVAIEIEDSEGMRSFIHFRSPSRPELLDPAVE